MSQFDVFRNPNPATRAAYPLLLDVQSDLIDALKTRVVVPLSPASAMTGKPIETLMPVLEVAGRHYVMLTPQLAGIDGKQVGARVGALTQSRAQIIAALDLLITGT
jgi:toxin CcdB